MDWKMGVTLLKSITLSNIIQYRQQVVYKCAYTLLVGVQFKCLIITYLNICLQNTCKSKFYVLLTVHLYII